MRTQSTTLSFLTENKASHVRPSSVLRVAITLLVMLLTTTGAWAQFLPTSYYHISLNPNYPEEGAIAMVDVPVSDPTYTLTSDDEPTRVGYVLTTLPRKCTSTTMRCLMRMM